MIIVSVDNMPVACYDDLKPEQALCAYLDEFVPELVSGEILISGEGTAVIRWHGTKYDAKTDLLG